MLLKVTKETKAGGKKMLYFGGGQPGVGGRANQELTPSTSHPHPPHPTNNQWAKAFIDGGMGLYPETAVILTVM